MKSVDYWSKSNGVVVGKWRYDVRWDYKDSESLSDALAPYCDGELTEEEISEIRTQVYGNLKEIFDMKGNMQSWMLDLIGNGRN